MSNSGYVELFISSALVSLFGIWEGWDSLARREQSMVVKHTGGGFNVRIMKGLGEERVNIGSNNPMTLNLPPHLFST